MGCFEFVDDVMTCTLGIKNQRKALLKVDEFAQISKLEWGESKCQVMQVGRKTKVPDEWELGPKKIKNTTAYKYLGDIITSDGKYKQTIEKRSNQIQGIIRQINTMASSDIMRAVETKVLLELYHKCVIPTLANNAESWTLSTSDEISLDKTAIQALKRLFNLPEKTPSPSVIHSFGVLYLTQHIDMMKFMYLHKILKRNNEHWTKKMLLHLDSINLGWTKRIKQKLKDYKLEEDWAKIKDLPKLAWKRCVKTAVNDMNKQKLISNCMEKQGDTEKVKTKTKYILDQINSDSYKNEPIPEIVVSSKLTAKTLIIARSGMLQCDINYKGTSPETCKKCNVIDDENHRMNECPNWRNTTESQNNSTVNFRDIYSNDPQTLQKVIKHIQGVWELSLGNGTMKR